MSSTDNTTKDWRAETSPSERSAAARVRRMAIRLTSGVFWRLAGHLLLDGVTREARDAEVFSGIGFFSRPKQGANAEAVVVGDAENPIIIATRDEAVRQAIARLEQDSTAIYNTMAIVVIKPDGTIHIRSKNGTAQSTVRGQTYRSAEDTMLTALGVFATAIGALNPATSAAAAATLNAAITTFKAAAASYLTTVLKAE